MAHWHGDLEKGIDYTFKIIMIGNSGVGKSQLLNWWATDEAAAVMVRDVVTLGFLPPFLLQSRVRVRSWEWGWKMISEGELY